MDLAIWVTLAGVLLVGTALAGSMFSRLPLSTSMFYLGVGVALSPAGLGLAALQPIDAAPALERLAEVVVLISLFTSGLKLGGGWHNKRWLPVLRLALVSMLITVAAITFIGSTLLGLPLGAAVLLGGILAPTDPVLASDVQVASAADRDQLRFTLTGEGGLNDGTAFPVVMLGLGLLGLHDLGRFGWRWLAVDVLWATAAGIGIGALFGLTIGKLVLYLRREHHEAVGHDNFLGLGLIGLAYGAALLCHAYGFLAVFVAGVALRHIERQGTATATAHAAAAAAATATATAASAAAAAANPTATTRAASGPAQAAAPLPEQVRSHVEMQHADPLASHTQQLAVDPLLASAFMAHAVLSFNEQLDRIGELCAVVVIGLLLWAVQWQHAAWWFVLLMMLVVRPASVALGLLRSGVPRAQRRLMGWFGIRGVGSLFYLAYAINHGLDPGLSHVLTAITLSVVVVSIIGHGISVTPLMNAYTARRA